MSLDPRRHGLISFVSGELINVKMTWGIIRHFKENHNDVPCDD